MVPFPLLRALALLDQRPTLMTSLKLITPKRPHWAMRALAQDLGAGHKSEGDNGDQGFYHASSVTSSTEVTTHTKKQENTTYG